MKRYSKKKITAMLLLIAFIIGIFPDVSSGPIDENKPSPDYGVYTALEEVQDEKNSRINTPEILNATQVRFDNLNETTGVKVDLTSRRDIVSPDIPVPDMLPIFETMWDQDFATHNEILDWILPPPIGSGGPMNYYIYTKYNTNTTTIENWRNASLRPTLGLNFGGIDPNLDRWWDVDVNDDGMDDIQVFFDPVTELDFLSGYTPGQIIGLLQEWIQTGSVELGITVYFNIRKINDDPFNIPEFENLEVYVAKSMSYSNQNFILFLGLNLTDVVSELNCSVTVNSIEMGSVSFVEELQDIINQILPPPLGQGIPPSQITLNITYADLADLSGPYYLNWDSNKEAMDSIGLDVASAKIRFDEVEDTYEFINRSWVDVDFLRREPYNTAPTWAQLWLDADDDLSSFDKIEWRATHICDAKVRFFDSQENVTYAEIEINHLPREVDMSMTVEERNGQNITKINYSANSVVNYLTVRHYEFFDTSYENITEDSIGDEVEYVHLFLNITHIPVKLYLEGLFYLEELETTPVIDEYFEIVGQLLDTIANRVISRFSRIARTLSSIPYSILSIAEEGSFAYMHTYYEDTFDEIDELEFIWTSGDYVTTTGNYFAFYNNTQPSEYPIAQISLSGRISKIIYINSSFEEESFAEVKMMNNQEFRAIYADDINSLNAEVIISNVPGHIIVTKTPNILEYDGAGTTIDELRFISDYQGSYMELKISDLADHLTIEFDDDRTEISSTDSSQGKIGEIEFLATTGPILRMDGNYMLFRQEEDYSLASGRIKDISSVEYISGEGGKIEVQFAKENTLNISLLDNRSEKISADLIIDPMPSFISVNLSGLFSTGIGDIALPKLESGGILGLVDIVFGVATLGNEALKIIDEATQNALSNIGSILEDLSFSYSTTTSITLIAKILRGDEFTLNDVDWMHGISAKQKDTEEGTSMAAKLYLTGLPEEGSITTKVQGDDIFLDLDLTNYNPIHDWLCIDVEGIQERDVLLYINDIESGMDLDLRINLSAQMNVIPMRAIGDIHMDSDKDIGSLYARMRQTVPEISISEVFLSSVPESLDASFNLSGNISIYYHAEDEIEHMFLKNSRKRDGKFHDIYAILHELPDEILLSMTPAIDYDMDASLLQNMPSLDVYSTGNALDAYIFADGKGMGQVGTVELQAVNIGSYINAKYSNDEYRVDSGGVDYMWIHAMDLPITEGHKTKSIEMVGKDFSSFKVKVDMLFGNVPIINIDGTKGGEVQVVVDHESDGDKAVIALIDFKTKNGLPSPPTILINGGSVDLEKGTSHTVIPAPILSVFLSIFS